MALAATAGAFVQLYPFWMGAEVRNTDTTFHIQVIQRYFFATWSLFYDGCFNGLSLLANPTYSLFYWMNWPQLFFDFDFAYRLTYLLHYPVLAVGLFAWLRLRGCSQFAAASSALVVSFSGPVVSMAYRAQIHLFSVVWIPWLAYLIEALTNPGQGQSSQRSLCRKRKVMALSVGAGGLLVTMPLAGDVFSLIWGIILVALVAPLREGRAIGIGRGVEVLLAMAAPFAIGFAYVFLYLAQSYLLSERSQGLDFETVTSYSFHPARLVELALPTFWGDPASPEFRFSEFLSAFRHARSWWYPTVFVGPVGVIGLLVGLAFALRRRGVNRRLAIYGLLLMTVACGRFLPGIEWLRDVSVLGIFRYPAKLLLPSLMVLAPVMGMGFDVTLRRLRRLRQLQSLWRGGGLRARPERSQRKSRETDKWRHGRTALAGCVFLSAVLPPVFHDNNQSFFSEKDLAKPEILADIARDPVTGLPSRVFSDFYAEGYATNEAARLSLTKGTGRWGIPQFFCFDATIEPLNYAVSVEAMIDPTLSRHFGVTELLTASPVEALRPLEYSRENWQLRRADGLVRLSLRRPWSQVTWYGTWEPVRKPQPAEILRRIKALSAPPVETSVRLGASGLLGFGAPGWEPSGSAHCQEMPPVKRGKDSTNSSIRGQGSAVVQLGETSESYESYDRGRRFRISLESNCQGVLSVNRRFFPGWRVSVNGVGVEVAKVWGDRLGVRVPAGTVTVEGEFRPQLAWLFLPITVLIQGLSCLVVILLPFVSGQTRTSD